RGAMKQFPKVDVFSLQQEDSLQASMGSVPFRFGYALEANYTLQNDGTWFDISNGRVWKLDILSQGAYSMNFIFEDLFLPEGGELYLYNQDRTMVYGPISNKNSGDSDVFGTDLIQGDMISLELFE